MTASVGDVSDVTRQIYNTVAPYPSKIMKRERLKSNGQVFLNEENRVRDPNGSTYTTTGDSCSWFVAHCQELSAQFRAQNNLALFALADVPQQHDVLNIGYGPQNL